jgi:hypothetical protein
MASDILMALLEEYLANSNMVLGSSQRDIDERKRQLRKKVHQLPIPCCASILCLYFFDHICVRFLCSMLYCSFIFLLLQTLETARTGRSEVKRAAEMLAEAHVKREMSKVEDERDFQSGDTPSEAWLQQLLTPAAINKIFETPRKAKLALTPKVLSVAVAPGTLAAHFLYFCSVFSGLTSCLSM